MYACNAGHNEVVRALVTRRATVQYCDLEVADRHVGLRLSLFLSVALSVCALGSLWMCIHVFTIAELWAQLLPLVAADDQWCGLQQILPIVVQGNTALMIAASKGHTDIIMKLLRCGANRDAVNGEASVPRHSNAYCCCTP